jgi:hypothetical protein
LIVLLFVSLLVWFELSGIFVLLAFIVAVLIAFKSLRGTISLYKLHRDLVEIRTSKKEGSDSERSEVEGQGPPEPAPALTGSMKAWAISGKAPSEAVYLVQDWKRYTQPQERFCYAMFALELILYL